MATQVYDFPNGMAGGMNISVSPDKIDPSASPSMQNMCYMGGVPSKRPGFSRINAESLGPTPIRDMANFIQIGKEDVFLVVQGGRLFKKN